MTKCIRMFLSFKLCNIYTDLYSQKSSIRSHHEKILVKIDSLCNGTKLLYFTNVWMHVVIKSHLNQVGKAEEMELGMLVR